MRSARRNNPRASAPKTVPRMIASLLCPLPLSDADGSAEPVSAAAPRIEDVPRIPEVLEESNEVGNVELEDVLSVESEVDDCREEELCVDEDRSEVPVELDVSSSLVDEEVLLEDVRVVAEEDAVAATEATDAAEARTDVIWVYTENASDIN